jgi:tetratricopeptide (TPR) repeat protein
MDQSFIIRLQNISDSIGQGRDETTAFDVYLKDICAISPQSFNLVLWSENWRRTVIEFGQLFEKKDAGPYLIKLQTYVQNPDSVCEIAAFIHSEIIWNYFERSGEYNKDIIKEYINKFPHNPEFHNTYGQFLLANNTYDKAVFEHQRSLNIDNKSFHLIQCYFSAIKQGFEFYIERSKYDEAQKIIDDNIKFIRLKGINTIPLTGQEVMNRIFAMNDRIRDHKTIQQQIEYYKKEISNVVSIEQRRLIEVLGIFSAIIAFILANISIGLSSLNVREMLTLMTGMAIILLIFVISISYLFAPKLRYPPKLYFLKQPKFWTICILSILLAVLLIYQYHD